MNKIINKFLLAGDNFMSELHLGQPLLTYSACAPLSKYKEGIQKLKKKTQETGNSTYIYQNELDKAGFQHDMA